MANEWEIARGTGKCSAIGRELAEGEFYYAALFEQPDGFARKDYSIESWSGPPEGCFCYWKTRVPTREKKPSIIAVDNSLLVNLFCRLEEDDSEMRQKFRFVLALLLMRKRLLRMERTIHEDVREYWQMRLTAEQSVHRVLNPNLNAAEVERLNAQLGAILSGDSSVISAMEEQATDESLESASDTTDEHTPPTDMSASDITAATDVANTDDMADSSESDASESCATTGEGNDDKE